MAVNLGQAGALLGTLRLRWIDARTYDLDLNNALVLQERARVVINWVTLALAASTVLSSFGLSDQPYVTGAIASLTALSKVLEQLLGKPEEMGAHRAAMGELKKFRDHLNTLAGKVHDHLDERLQMELDQAVHTAQQLGEDIENVKRARMKSSNRKRADVDFGETAISRALDRVDQLKLDPVAPAAPPSDLRVPLPAEAFGVVPVLRRTG